MGRMFAEELSSLDNRNVAIKIHLTNNFYPPIPAEMAQTCLEAIDVYHNTEDDEILIPLPVINGFQVQWRGQNSAPIWSIIEQHKLWPWVGNSDGYEDEAS